MEAVHWTVGPHGPQVTETTDFVRQYMQGRYGEKMKSDIARKLRSEIEDARGAYPDGTIIRWDLLASSQKFTYVAIYAAGLWYTTSATSALGKKVSNKELMDYFRNPGPLARVANVKVATEFEDVL